MDTILLLLGLAFRDDDMVFLHETWVAMPGDTGTVLHIVDRVESAHTPNGP